MQSAEEVELEQTYEQIYRLVDSLNPTDVDAGLSQLEATLVMILSDDPTITDVHKTYVSQVIGNFVRNVLGKRFATTDLPGMQRINQFCSVVLSCAIKYIADDGAFEMVDCVRRILDDSRQLYYWSSFLKIKVPHFAKRQRKFQQSTFDDSSDEETLMTELQSPVSYGQSSSDDEELVNVESNQQKVYARDPSLGGMGSVSPLLLLAINHFGQEGGFDTITARLKDTPRRMPFKYLRMYLTMAYNVRTVVATHVRDSFFVELQKYTFDYFLTLTNDELRPLDRKDFQSASDDVARLLATTSLKNRQAELLETFHLQFAIKCFQSPMLDKRVSGLIHLEDVLQQAVHREVFEKERRLIGAGSMYTDAEGFRKTKFLTQGEFKLLQDKTKQNKKKIRDIIKFVAEHNILKDIFVHSSSVELIRKSTRLIVELARCQALSEEDLATIWSATVDKHDSIIGATITLLNECCLSFQTAHLLFFVEKIKYMKPKQLRTRTLTLLANITKASAFRSHVAVAVDILWNIVFGDVAVKDEVYRTAISTIETTIEMDALRDQRREYIAKLMEYVKQQVFVVQAERVLTKLVQSLAKEISPSLSLLDTLDAKNVVLRELMLYGQSHLESGQASGALTAQRHTTEEKFTTRLGLLRMLMMHSDLIGHNVALTNDDITTLWQAFVIGSDASQAFEAVYHRDLFFTWLQRLLEVSTMNNNVQTVDLVFQLLGTLPVAFYSSEAFSCFSAYFFLVNTREGRLNRTQEVVKDLLGIAPLWNFCFNSVDDFKLGAQSLLIAMHERFAASFTGNKAAHRNRFIVTVFNRLQSLLKGNLSSSSTGSPLLSNSEREIRVGKSIGRCLELLQAFLNQTKPAPYPPHFRGRTVKLNVINKTGTLILQHDTDVSEEKFPLSQHLFDRVLTLKQHLAKVLKLDVKNLTLKGDTSSAELNDDHQLSDIHLFDDSTVVVFDSSVQQQQQQQEKEEEQHQKQQQKSLYTIHKASKLEKEQAVQILEILPHIPLNAAVLAIRRSHTVEHAIGKLMDDMFVQQVFDDVAKMEPDEEELVVPETVGEEDTGADAAAENVPDESAVLLLVEDDKYFSILMDILQLRGTQEVQPTSKRQKVAKKRTKNDPLAGQVSGVVVDHENVWNVLMALPTNQVLLSRFKNPQQTSWKTDLDNSLQSGYQLLYSLQVINSLLQEEDHAEWAQSFLKNGGFHRVYEILVDPSTDDLYRHSLAYRKALTYLFYIMLSFLKGDTTMSSVIPASSINPVEHIAATTDNLRHSGETVSMAIDFPKFVHRLMKQIWMVAEVEDRSFLLQADSEEKMLEWIDVIQNATADLLNSQQHTIKPSAYTGQGHAEVEVSGNPYEPLRQLDESNKVCADCGAADPDWASINLGILVCIECSGLHRNLGVHISKVRSFALDKWDDEVSKVMLQLGNNKVNSIFEAELSDSSAKPHKDSSRAVRETFIKDKYQKKMYVSDLGLTQEQLDRQLYEHVVANAEASQILGLLIRGGSPNAQLDQGKTSLHASVLHGSAETLTLLLQNRGNPNVQDDLGNTPLHYVAFHGLIRKGYILFKNGGKLDLVNNNKETALETAVAEQQADTVTFIRLAQLAVAELENDSPDESFMEALKSFSQDIQKRKAEQANEN